MRVACGENHTMIVKNGRLYGTGYNNYGQLGTGTNKNESKFVQIVQEKQIEQVACGKFHTMVVTEDGLLYGSGLNNYGQLGLGVGVGTGTSTNSFTFEHIDVDGKKVIQVSCGQFHTMVITKDGMLYGAGSDWYGPLGTGCGNDAVLKFVPIDVDGKKVKQVACGYYHTIIITEDGMLYGAGKNGRCQLGKKRSWKELKFVPIDVSGKKVKYVACGSGHTMVITEDDMLFGAGKNRYGQLANGLYGSKHDIDQPKFTLINIGEKKIRLLVTWGSTTMIVTEDGMLHVAGSCYGFGFNQCQPKFVPIDVHGKKVTHVSHSITITEDNLLYGIGDNYYGQLGDGSCKDTEKFIPILTIPSTGN